MPKVAYVFGFSGAGKGHIAKQLQKDVQALELDILRDNAANKFSPCDTGLWRCWERRRDLFETFDVASSFSEILAQHWPKLSGDRPVLAEGFDLGHDRWREAFRAALVDRGITITDERKLWIHPRADVVWTNRQDRGWESQRNETLEEVHEQGECYRKRVSHHSNCQYEDVEEAIRDMRQFFCGDSLVGCVLTHHES